MSGSRLIARVRAWFGPVAAAIAVGAAVWLTGEYLHAVWVAPADAARIASLQAKAHVDNTVHGQLLQPEFDRQRDALQRRVRVYRAGGLVLLVSLGSFLAWLRWFRPDRGFWAGVAGGRTSAEPRPKKKVKSKAGARAASYDGEPDWAAGQGLAAASGASGVEIRIGTGSCGVAAGAIGVGTAIRDAVASIGGGALVKRVGCSGFCHAEPTVEVVEDGRSTLYAGVEAADARQLVRRHVTPNGAVGRLREVVRDARGRLVDDAAWVPIVGREVDTKPWLDGQVRVVLENCGRIDPLSLDDYRRHDGCRGVADCLERLSPDEVVEQVRAAGLRHRRGASGAVAAAWAAFRNASGADRCIVCNADEGDPAAATARTLLESDPFRVIEGLVIAGYAVGAGNGVLRVRRADRVAAERARAAVHAAEQAGLLGDRVMGSAFGFRLDVVESAGPSWCGDEAALADILQGARAGGVIDLRDRTPLVTDVETMAALPWILRRGPAAYAAVGTAAAGGTRVLSLGGKIVRGGLVEVPMGTSIRRVVQDIGGGVPGGGPLKAVLAGGPFGVCIPAASADMRIDDDLFAAAGATVGSGSLVVLDGADCIVEATRRTLRTHQKDACRGCARFTAHAGAMLEILDRVCKGAGQADDLDRLSDLALRASDAASCGPAKAAPNLVLTTLEWFREEYVAHVQDRRCPAATCRSLIHYTVHDGCVGCTLCAQVCPLGAIEARPYSRHEIDHNRCTRCGLCVTTCVEHAIEAV